MISEASIRTGMKAFLVSNCGVPSASCVKGFGNRAATPKGSFVVMTLMLTERTSTNVHEELATVVQGSVTTFQDTTFMPSQGTVQLDFYGENAWTWANKAAIYLRDEVGCSFLISHGIQPLYCNDPKNLTGLSGEEQYQARWMVEAILAFNQSDTRTVDFFTNIELDTQPEL